MGATFVVSFFEACGQMCTMYNARVNTVYFKEKVGAQCLSSLVILADAPMIKYKSMKVLCFSPSSFFVYIQVTTQSKNMI